jgi:hypothetical protein
VLLALAALTRGEAIALLVLLVVPLFWREKRRIALAVATFVVVLSPWTIRNLATFEEPVLISTNSNGLWTGANCHETYYGDLIGSWRFQCYTPERPGEDESEYFLRQRHQGVEYLREHRGRVPAVAGARFLRLIDAWDLGQSQFLNAAEGRASKPTRWGIRMAWVLMVLAVAGAVIRRRRGEGLLILGAPVVMTILVAVATYGSTRFRFAAEPSIVILAAVTLAAAVRAMTARTDIRVRRRPQPV